MILPQDSGIYPVDKKYAIVIPESGDNITVCFRYKLADDPYLEFPTTSGKTVVVDDDVLVEYNFTVPRSAVQVVEEAFRAFPAIIIAGAEIVLWAHGRQGTGKLAGYFLDFIDAKVNTLIGLEVDKMLAVASVSIPAEVQHV